jgi:glutamate/tyrosine decarboxylase-like PLP-dependent enzyme
VTALLSGLTIQDGAGSAMDANGGPNVAGGVYTSGASTAELYGLWVAPPEALQPKDHKQKKLTGH